MWRVGRFPIASDPVPSVVVRTRCCWSDCTGRGVCTHTIGRSPRRRCSQRWELRGCCKIRSEVEIAVGSRTRCFAGPSSSPSGIADVPRFVKAHWGCSGRFGIAARFDTAKVVPSQRSTNLGSSRRVGCVPCVRLVVQCDQFHHRERRTPREQFVSE